jgi:NTP pyrophosphatase (non-canonical NTP hydrolase)
MSFDIYTVLAAIIAERKRQDEKWGVQFHTAVEWVSILAEEVGEAATEANELHFAGTPRLAELRAEVVQVAAVAVAIVEWIDQGAKPTP